MGSKSSAPAAPDYTAAANAQGAANLASAQASAKLSNPNITSPYGSQTVTYGTPTFDQAGYDKAMQAYNTGQPVFDAVGYNKAMSNYKPTSAPQYIDIALTDNMGNQTTQNVLNPSYMAMPDKAAYTTTASSGNAPNRADYTTYGGDLNVPNITQTLSPNSQAVLDAQQKTQLGLANLSNNALGTAQNILSTPFQYQGPGVQTALGQPGAIQGAPDASKYLANGQLDLSGVAKMPVNAGMTGQEAIMNPQIQQDDASYANILKNQGITLGSEAYNNAMRVHNQQKNDLLSQAALQGINLDMSANNQGYNQALSSGQFGNQATGQNYNQGLSSMQAGNAAQNQGFNQGLASGQFANTAQQQAYLQQLGQRQMPLNEIAAMMSGSQIQNPQFPAYNGTQVAPAPIYQAAQNQYSAGLQSAGMENANSNSMNSGLMQLGGMGLKYALGGPAGLLV
jgi:hypothetical protein